MEFKIILFVGAICFFLAQTSLASPDVINKLKELNQRRNGEGPVIPILVIACNRVSVRDTLDDLIKYRKDANQFPIIVSQDCNHESTRKVIESYKQVTLIAHPHHGDISVPGGHGHMKGYYKISRHYGWALNTTFKAEFDSIIIVEDDLNVAPDFYEYFLGTHKLLKNDPTLWCVSAFFFLKIFKLICVVY